MLTTQDSNKAMGCSGGSDVGVDDDVMLMLLMLM
jgi:hypothetical protein